MEDQEFINQLAEKLSKLGTVRPLGFHYLHPYGTVPADSIICNGATYSRALYKDFFDYITTQGWVKTEAEWQEIATRDNGFCPFYSSGDGSTTFRTPKFAPFMQVAITSANVGKYHQAGLPNIEGTFTSHGHTYGLECTGAFTGEAFIGIQSNTGSASDGGRVTMDASLSSSIYGRSTTVQSESHEWMICVVVAGQATNLGSVDVSNVMSAVAQVQAQVDEIPKPKAYITETWHSGTSWYRKWSDGWIEQGGFFTPTTDDGSAPGSLLTFHLAFSNMNYSVQASLVQDDGGMANSKNIYVYKRSRTTVNVSFWGDYGEPICWYAYGY